MRRRWFDCRTSDRQVLPEFITADILRRPTYRYRFCDRALPRDFGEGGGTASGQFVDLYIGALARSRAETSMRTTMERSMALQVFERLRSAGTSGCSATLEVSPVALPRDRESR